MKRFSTVLLATILSTVGGIGIAKDASANSMMMNHHNNMMMKGGTMHHRMGQMGSTGQNVKNTQASLKRMGFYKGSVDGMYGPMTRMAVMKFQRSKGLKVNGMVNASTRAAMMR